MRWRALLAATLLLCIHAAEGAVLNVPSQFADIQSAINASSDGDEVVVAPGTYTGAGNRELHADGRRITIRSSSGPGGTVIDCQRQGRAFFITQNQTQPLVVDGFTIRNGLNLPAGGGIGVWGGATSTIRNCTFMSCGDLNGSAEGGAIRIAHSATTVIQNCRIVGCTADVGGGIMVIDQSNPTIRECVIQSCWGGGIYLWDRCSPLITDCEIADCTASGSSYGGGICVYENCSPRIENCYLHGNSTPWNGGGIRLDNGDPTILHCTIVGSVGGVPGAGVHATSSSGSMVNCIVWDCVGGSALDVCPAFTVSYCDIQGGHVGTGNFDQNPGFTSNVDVHLMAGSPCIDRGTDVGVSVDFDGEPRPQGGGFDVGCDEWPPPPTTIDATLWMPSHHYNTGDICWLNLELDNGGSTAAGRPVFVLLEVLGTYYFWPSWTQGPPSIDYQVQTIPAGSDIQPILSSFGWPSGVGSASGLQFMAAVTDPGMTQLAGSIGTWSFSYSP